MLPQELRRFLNLKKMFWNKKKNTTEPIITHCAFHCDETSKGKIIYGKLEVFKIGDKVSIDEMFYTISDFWYNVDRGYIMYSIKLIAK